MGQDNDIKDAHKVFQLLRTLVKYGITALTVLCTVHCGLLAMGHDLLGVHLLLCAFLFVLGLCLSRFFGLCWVHKACVVYTCTVVVFIVLKRHGILSAWGVDIDLIRGVMCILGMSITTLVLWKTQEKNCCKNSER